MARAITAIYRTNATAKLVWEELERLGIARQRITVLPAMLIVPDTTDPSRSTTARRGDLDDALDRLHDLHLPENDVRIYQQALRNGDYVVSAEVDNDADLARIERVMRRPEEAYDLDELDSAYGTADYMPRRHPLGPDYDERQVGRRHDEQFSPYTRSYGRDVPLVPAIAVALIGTR